MSYYMVLVFVRNVGCPRRPEPLCGGAQSHQESLPGLGPTMLLHITSLVGAGVLHEGTTNICKLIMCVKCSEELLALNAHTARRCTWVSSRVLAGHYLANQK